MTGSWVQICYEYSVIAALFESKVLQHTQRAFKATLGKSDKSHFCCPKMCLNCPNTIASGSTAKLDF